MNSVNLRLIQWCAEFVPKEKIGSIPGKARGIYALYKQNGPKRFDVLYIGMASKSIRYRLLEHARTKKVWTHFSIYEVWPNITEDEIKELEGLFLHIYRKDRRANISNVNKRYGPLLRVREKNLERIRKRWIEPEDLESFIKSRSNV